VKICINIFFMCPFQVMNSAAQLRRWPNDKLRSLPFLDST